MLKDVIGFLIVAEIGNLIGLRKMFKVEEWRLKKDFR
jgi:hypothetical protein